MIHPAGKAVVDPESDPRKGEIIARFFEAIRSGDYAALSEVLTPGAVTRWPQSGERITGAMACVRVYENYPGGAPAYQVQRILGSGDTWVAELIADYGPERWHAVSVVEFEGDRIARMTDYFGPAFAAPEWREELVDREDPLPGPKDRDPAGTSRGIDTRGAS